MKLATSALLLFVSAALAAPLDARTDPDSTLVQSNKLRRVILRSNLLAKAQTLLDFAYASPNKNRLIDTPGHQSTINWLVETTTALGYNVTTQDFNVDSGTSSITVGGVHYSGNIATYSPAGNPVAPVVAVANIGCETSDYPDLTGKIALIKRGECQFGLKSAYAGAAGAIGVLLYNNIPEALNPTLGEPTRPEGPYPPTLGISGVDGEAIFASLTSEVIGEIKIEYTTITTTNVIAQTFGGDQNNVVHVGAHSDSVAAGPGINDNGSGTIGILEVATQLVKFTVNNAVRFSWWSAEEEGLLGAEAYVASLPQSELDKIRLYLNFDMIASPNFYYGIYDGDGSAFGTAGAPGSAEAEKLFEDFFDIDEDLPHAPSEFNGRSDYGPFLDVGIPCGGLDTGAEGIKTEEEAAIFGGTAGIAYDPNYHGAGDTVKNLNVGAFLHNTKAIAHAVATYGRSFDSLPSKPLKRAAKKEEAVRQFKGTKALW